MSAARVSSFFSWRRPRLAVSSVASGSRSGNTWVLVRLLSAELGDDGIGVLTQRRRGAEHRAAARERRVRGDARVLVEEGVPRGGDPPVLHPEGAEGHVPVRSFLDDRDARDARGAEPCLVLTRRGGAEEPFEGVVVEVRIGV